MEARRRASNFSLKSSFGDATPRNVLIFHPERRSWIYFTKNIGFLFEFPLEKVIESHTNEEQPSLPISSYMLEESLIIKIKIRCITSGLKQLMHA